MALSSNEKAVFHLRVIRAANLATAGYLRRSPNTYVKIQVEEFARRTELVKGTLNPSWDQEFAFTTVPTSIIHLRLKHEPHLFQRKTLGRVDIDILELLTLGTGKKDVVLKVKDARKDTKSHDKGDIIVQFWSEDNVKASTTALEDVRQAVKEKLEEKKSATKSLGRVLTKLQVFAAVLDEASKVHPYVSIVWKTASSMYKIVEKQIDHDERVIELMGSMDDAYSSIAEIRSIRDQTTRLKRAIEAIISETFECAMFIQEYAGHGFSKRALRDTLSSSTSEKILQFTAKFKDLKNSLDTGVGFQTMLVLSRAFEKVENIATNQTLDMLQPKLMSPYGRPECLQGTRVEILEFIMDWSTSANNDTNMLWLYGVAGSGKSTLATTVANFFIGMRRLGAHLFFIRNTTDSSPAHVIRTLAYQIGCSDPRIGHAISSAIHSIPHLVRSSSLVQFQQLLAEPLISVVNLQLEGPIVVVIDALDECGSPEDRYELLSVLGRELTKLPSIVRVIVTSRPEYDIQNHFSSANGITIREIKITSADAQADVGIFIRFQMNRIRERNKLLGLPADWPGHDRIVALVRRASGLFIWASTACRFIDAHDPDAQLSVVLQNDIHSDAESALDALYTTALKSAGNWNDPTFGTDFQTVVGTLLIARDLLPTTGIDKLNDGPRPSLHIISRLGCLLYNDSVVRILHPSFADFLTNRDRCKSDQWFVDVNLHHLRIAERCMQNLDGFLKRNVCGLKLSETPSYKDLPADIAYACRFWVEHVCLASDPQLIVDKVEAFIFKHILHWLEAMSILRKSPEAVGILQRLLIWVQTSAPENLLLRELIHDGHRFTQTFINAIDEHPLLIYSTALPFTPVDTLLYKTFHDRELLPVLSVGYEKTWSPLICVHEHNANVHSLAFSPDGGQIASLSQERIQLRDTLTGADVGSPIPLSPGRGTGSLAFSPNDAHVASSWRRATDCDDWDVCLWNMSTSTKTLGPLKTGPVMDPYNSVASSRCSVAFSPDGSIVATCNPEGKIYMWEISTGREIFSPLNDPGPAVGADLLSFFPNSRRVISSSQGKLFIWGLENGKLLLGPLVGDVLHNSVDAIAISLDGMEFFSIARGILRTWNSQSGSLIRVEKLLAGEYRYRRAASFSYDTRQVALGNPDGSIFVFNTTTGARIYHVDKQYGHSGLYHLIFSPDSKIIAAAFHDRTVRVYSAAIAEQAASDTTRDKYSRIKLIAYSQDGNYVVFAARSHDVAALYVLDVHSGRQITQPILDAYVSPVNNIKTVKFLHKKLGLWIAFVSPDHNIRIRQLLPDAQSNELVISREDGFMPSLMDISADGERVVISDCASAWHDGFAAVEVWDTNSQTRILGPLRGPQAQSDSIAFSPDGAHILSLGSVLCVWNAMTGSIILEKYDDAIQFVRAGYSPDGTMIVTHSYDDNISYLNAISGAQTVSWKSFPKFLQSSHLDNFAIDSTDRWIKEVKTSRRICQLPPTLRDCNGTISSNSSITIDIGGGLVVIHFPSCALEGSLLGCEPC